MLPTAYYKETAVFFCGEIEKYYVLMFYGQNLWFPMEAHFHH